MSVYEMPSLAGLLLKLALLAYAVKSPVRTPLTRLFVGLLVLLSLFNVVEFIGLWSLDTYGFRHEFQIFGFLYFFLFIPCIALFTHISIWISTEKEEIQKGLGAFLLYIPALILEFFLLGTDKLVLGFVPEGHSILRIPGNWYFLFETFSIVYMLAAVSYLIYGAFRNRPTVKKIRNRLWLAGLAPLVSLSIYLIVAHHFGSTKLTATFYTPLAIAFFLAVTTYAVHQYRLFDIEFYIPWSKVRKRKTAFYRRIMAMVSEIADFGSVERAIEKLSETLNCGVALIGGNTAKPVLAFAGTSRFMTEIPHPILQRFDHIVVANEIADTLPDIHALMKNHGVSAIVPFHPHSQYASGWLLLGESFSEQVYTKQDFKVVELLFEKMGDLFLDRLLTMRAQLAAANRQILALEKKQAEIEPELIRLREEIQGLRDQNLTLLQQQPFDSLAINPIAPHGFKSSITLIGRDKELLRTLRGPFPHIEHFVSITSIGFRRHRLPDVLVCRIESRSERDVSALIDLLLENPLRGVLLYGPDANDFLERHKNELELGLVEAVPATAEAAGIIRRVMALSELKQASYSLTHPECPLIGQSPAFTQQMDEIRRVARLGQPVIIGTPDENEAVSVATYLHKESDSDGAMIIVRGAAMNAIAADEAMKQIEVALENAERGTLLVTAIDDIGPQQRQRLVAAIAARGTTRWLVSASSFRSIERELRVPFYPFVVEMPRLCERSSDLPLLVHYFTLQFNLLSGVHHYIRQSEFEDMIEETHADTLVGLRHRVFSALKSQIAQTRTDDADLQRRLSDKTLDQHIAEYEAYIIEQTLKRCDGNKSKAARLLGVKANTLHYKLRRYGLNGDQV